MVYICIPGTRDTRYTHADKAFIDIRISKVLFGSFKIVVKILIKSHAL